MNPSNKLNLLPALLLSAALLSPALSPADQSLSLAGQWRFQLDRADAGVQERWFERPLEQRIKLPGALQNQGFGDDITVDTKWTGEVSLDAWLKGPQYAKYRQPGNIKVPFFLQPEKHYVGAAWYQRDVEIPAAWQGKRVVLSWSAPTGKRASGWTAGEIGTNTSLSTPHSYDLGTGLAPGKHTLTIRVDNRLIVNVGAWAHSVTDHTQGNWNGMIGRLELPRPPAPSGSRTCRSIPNVAKKSAAGEGAHRQCHAANRATAPSPLAGRASRWTGTKRAAPPRWRWRSGNECKDLGRVQSRPPDSSPSGSRASRPTTSGR